MSFVIYGDRNYKKIVIANDIEEAYNMFVSQEKKYDIENYHYKIERLFDGI